MTVKLSAALPTEESTYNGLEAIRDALLAQPKGVHVVVALVDCVSSARNHDKGAEVPTVRVVQVEVMAGYDEGRAQSMLSRRYAQRTGREQLPIAEMGLREDDVPF